MDGSTRRAGEAVGSFCRRSRARRAPAGCAGSGFARKGATGAFVGSFCRIELVFVERARFLGFVLSHGLELELSASRRRLRGRACLGRYGPEGMIRPPAVAQCWCTSGCPRAKRSIGGDRGPGPGGDFVD